MTADRPAPEQARVEVGLSARFVSSAQERLLTEYADRILSDVFQGKRPELRDHLIGLAAKVSRKHPWPYFEECVQAEVTARRDADRRAVLAEAERRIEAESQVWVTRPMREDQPNTVGKGLVLATTLVAAYRTEVGGSHE